MTRLLPLVVLGLGGCTFDEGFVITDLKGEIILPEAAATRTFLHSDGSTETITDPRNIGPVYLGLYPSLQTGLESYTHPEIGPVFKTGIPGDAYPYGGTSVGDLRFPCMEFLQCKVISGRYVNFDEMVSWFNDTLEQPITDANGHQVTSGDYIAQTCFDLLHYSDASEIRLTATDDRNGDGTLDAKDLDFVQQDDGTFRGEFTIYQQEYFENKTTGEGFSLWGWMDAPSEINTKFTTCDPTGGFTENTYNADFQAGRPYRDLLNFPSLYISGGDWVSTDGFKYQTPDDFASITLDFQVKE